MHYLTQDKIGKALTKFLRFVIPGKNDILERVANFATTGNLGSQQEIFKDLKQHYPDNTKFCILSMDFDQIEAGMPKPGYDYISQLNELAELKKKFPENVYPFIFVDPRRKNILEIMKYFIETHSFTGIKIYPPLGYFPHDIRLDPVWKYAEKNKIPIISHVGLCMPLVHYRGKKHKLISILLNNYNNINLEVKRKSQTRLCDYFTHPDNYRILLNKYKNLKLCLAHSGGEHFWKKYITIKTGFKNKLKEKEENWLKIILKIIDNPNYPNVYMDISATLYDEFFHPLLKKFLNKGSNKVREHILFGSDYYMNKFGGNEKIFSLNVRKFLGEKDYEQISDFNAAKFIKSKIH